jgi:hypothetical protein
VWCGKQLHAGRLSAHDSNAPHIPPHSAIWARIEPDWGCGLCDEQVAAVLPECKHGWFFLISIHLIHFFVHQYTETVGQWRSEADDILLLGFGQPLS